MSTKSYTLADGSTATVNATDNDIPFNEGMNVLSKAIKAKIDTSSGGTTEGLLADPELTVTKINDIEFKFSHLGDGKLTVSNSDCKIMNVNSEGVVSLDFAGEKLFAFVECDGTHYADYVLVNCSEDEHIKGWIPNKIYCTGGNTLASDRVDHTVVQTFRQFGTGEVKVLDYKDTVTADGHNVTVNSGNNNGWNGDFKRLIYAESDGAFSSAYCTIHAYIDVGGSGPL